MSGLFRRRSSTPAAPEASAAPEAAPAATPAATMGESRAPVTRASTMLSTRRRAEDTMVGTKKLLGQ